MKRIYFALLLPCLFVLNSVAQTGLNIDDNQDLFAVVNNHPEYRSPVSRSHESRLYRVPSRGTLPLEPAKMAGVHTLKSGMIIGLSASGDTQFVAHYKRNKLKGEWLSWFDNNQVCDQGELKNNIPDGEWKSFYPNGNLRFIRTYDAFKLEKAKRDIRLRQSKAVMSPIASLARKNLRAAYSFLHPDYSFHTLASQPHHFSSHDNWQSLNERVASNIDPAASAYVPPFLECLHHGLYMNFFEDGSVKDSGYYNNGLREGIWDEWVENGEIRAHGYYLQGHKADTWKYYDKQGNLRYIKTYNKNGKEIHRKSFAVTDAGKKVNSRVLASK